MEVGLDPCPWQSCYGPGLGKRFRESQARQNVAMSGFSVAHFGQTGTRRVCLDRVRGERFAPLSNPYGL
jgi:hypothetical protein